MKKFREATSFIAFFSLIFLRPSYAQLQSTNGVKTAQELADTNLSENRAIQKEDIKLGDSTSKCTISLDSSIDRMDAEDKYNKSLLDQGFSKTNGLFDRINKAESKLNSSVNTMNSSTGHISSSTKKLSAADKEKIKDYKDQALDLTSQKDAAVIQVAQLEQKCALENPCSAALISQIKVSKAKAEVLNLKIKKIEVDINKIIAANTNTGGGKPTTASSASAAARIGVANSHGAYAEAKMNELRASIATDEANVNKILKESLERLDDVLLQANNNDDYEMYELAKAAIDESVEGHDKVVISNLEVMSTATAAINLLKCEDLSETQSRSYPLFMAAAATYIASFINDTSDRYNRGANCILKCIKLDEIKKDKENNSLQKRIYPEFNKKEFADIEPNCKSSPDLLENDGMYINDNNVDEDKNEQVRSAERAMNLYHNMVDAFEAKLVNTGSEMKFSGKESKAGALDMFKAAHAAALMEVTTRTELVKAAEGQLARAEAWERESAAQENEFAQMAKQLRSALLFAEAAVAQMMADQWGGENDRAKADVIKWKGELTKARTHGLMKCNFPGDNSKISDTKKPKSFPLIYDMNVIHPRVVAFNPIKSHNPYHQLYALIKKKLNPSSKFVWNFLFPEIFAVVEDENFNKDLGLNEDAGSFTFYSKMRLGAWKLQTNNAAILVNLRPSSIDISGLNPKEATQENLFDYVRKNTTIYNDKPIRKTGFPLPETRAIYIGAVIKMIENNIFLLEGGLKGAQANLNGYRKLVNKMRRVFDLDTDGNEDDQSKQVKKAATCMKNDGGFIKVDKKCQCKKTNSCASFKNLNFKKFNLSPVESTSELSIKKANSVLKGDLENAKLADAKLIGKKEAINQTLIKLKRKLYKNGKGSNIFKANNSNLGLNKESLRSKTESNNKSNTNSNVSSSTGSSSSLGVAGFGGNLKQLSKSNSAELRAKRLKERLAKNKREALKRRKLLNSSLVHSSYKNLNTRKKESGKASLRPDYANMEDLKFNNNRNNRNGKFNDEDMTLSQNTYNTRRRPKNYFEGIQINEESYYSIFKIISNRYKRSAGELYDFTGGRQR